MSGHLKGDKCFQRVALELSKQLKRQRDFCARYGGEEFVLLLPNTNIEEAFSIAEQCCKAVSLLNILHNDSDISRVVTISAGVASFIPLRDIPLLSLIDAADKELYRAKENGRNRVENNKGQEIQ